MASVRAAELGLNLDHWCFGCGRANPIGLRLDVTFGRGTADARFTGEERHQGYDGMVHGGLVAALLDEVMGWAIFHQGIWALTARATLAYRRPVPIGHEVVVSGAVVRDRGRLIEMRGEVRGADGELLATADATYVRMSQEQRDALIEKYGDPSPALERLAVAMKKGSE